MKKLIIPKGTLIIRNSVYLPEYIEKISFKYFFSFVITVRTIEYSAWIHFFITLHQNVHSQVRLPESLFAFSIRIEEEREDKNFTLLIY